MPVWRPAFTSSEGLNGRSLSVQSSPAAGLRRSNLSTVKTSCTDMAPL